jgi:hypothetical protein
MKSSLKGLLIATILSALPLAAAMAAAPTKDEVVAVVKKAVEFYKPQLATPTSSTTHCNR